MLLIYFTVAGIVPCGVRRKALYIIILQIVYSLSCGITEFIKSPFENSVLVKPVTRRKGQCDTFYYWL